MVVQVARLCGMYCLKYGLELSLCVRLVFGFCLYYDLSVDGALSSALEFCLISNFK